MSKPKLPAVSPSEMEVLRLLWRLEKGTVFDVHARLPAERDIAPATVQTLLRRLEFKGYVAHHKKGKAYVFTPVAKKEDVIKRSIGDFVEQLFGGDPIPLIHYLAEHGAISLDDIDHLRKIVKKN